MTPDQVERIVQDAILTERRRLANRIRNSLAQFRYGFDGHVFNWDDTVERLAREIEKDG